ncbi:MAG: caspase family protein [Desulfobacterales bacterium]
MASNRNFLPTLIAFILFFVTLSQNSFAQTYKWDNFIEPFRTKIRVDRPVQIKINLPETILKNNKKIPLIVKHRGLGRAGIGTVRGLVTVNDQPAWRGYWIGDYPGSETYKIFINTKDLRVGSNTIYFRAKRDIAYKSTFTITELRFDLTKLKGIKTLLAKSQSSLEENNQKSNFPDVKFSQDKIPPKIIITSHDISRGIKPLQNQKKVTISGKAYDENGIVEITINNKDATFDEAGNFETDVYLKMGKNQIVVSAMDVYENRANKEFTITRVASKRPSKAKIAEATAGNYYALVIGNNNYQYLRRLETAQNDARKVAETLKLRYGFDTNLLLDADRDAILDAINNFRRILKQDDQFLIYYAGHGSFDKIASKAYWLPVDAQRNNDKNWIIVDTITSNIKRISSNHVLIVADSCYSGTFTRTSSLAKLESAQKRRVYLKKMQAKKSRTLLASGGNEPVSDIGGEGNSVFAKAFLAGLTNMDLNGFTAEELYIQYIKEMVAGSSDQTPEYNIIRNSGHEGRDFVFKRKN